MEIAVVDDFLPDRQKVLKYIHKYCTEHQIMYHAESFENGEVFLNKACQSHFRFDIVFLDIYLGNMGNMDGMKVAAEFRKIDPFGLLVFCTTSEKHAVQSYRVRAFDYLLKPYDYHNFSEVLKLCDNALLKQARYIEVKEGRVIIKILLRDILYTDYSNHYILIHTENRIYRTYLSFSEFSQILSPYPQFLCCYRNCIVNLDKTVSMDEHDFILSNGERVPIARNLRVLVRQKYADYAFQQLEEGL